MELNGNTRHASAPDKIAGDRRADRRYPIELELKYKLVRRKRILDTGTGHTIDLSSGGVLFEAERSLPAGLNVELSVTWPVLLHNVAPMRLLIVGRVVRNDRNKIAIRTVKHEFRTQGGSRGRADASGPKTGLDRPPLSNMPPYYQAPPRNPLNKL